MSAFHVREFCRSCSRKRRSWRYRRWWHSRGGAQRHKWNRIRRERMAEKASRRQANTELWRTYRMMYAGADSDWPSFRAAALGQPMPEMPQCLSVPKP